MPLDRPSNGSGIGGPAAEPKNQMMRCTCPLTSKPGDMLTVMFDGRKYALAVPTGVLPGQEFRIMLSVPDQLRLPDGNNTLVLKTAEGEPDGLDGRVNGAIIEVRVDHDAGTLSYSVNDGPPLLALSGFPKGVALLPWASLMYPGDRVSFASAYVRAVEA